MHPRWSLTGFLAVALWMALLAPGNLSVAGSGEAVAATAENATLLAPGRRLAQLATKAPGGAWTTVDHSKLKELQKEFTEPEQVTEACLGCHTKAGEQIMHTMHWTWMCKDCGPDSKIGKAGLTLNNFCISLPGNEPRCTSCHIGFGWKDASFDFKEARKIDCLVCHEKVHNDPTVKPYLKFPTAAGYPAKTETVFPGDGLTYSPPDWAKVAQSVARPDRWNCGVCHFLGGGGDMVKHGDLDTSLTKPKKALDVHMDAEGLNFSCARCHTTKEHQIAGRSYSLPASQEKLSLTEADLASKIACESCHGQTPHKPGVKANDHVDKVACQTCHIPAFAREKPTKMRWDWTTAGKMNGEGKPFKTKGPLGTPSYDTQKGDFLWAKDVVPEYRWWNGAMSYALVTDQIDPTRLVSLNKPLGEAADSKARIMPFKRHTGKQPYDAGRKTMVFPKLFGPKGSGAYWGDWDWKTSIAKGMEAAGQPFSGEVGWVETEYFFPTTHMVAPKDQSLTCEQCHSAGGRMRGLPGVYMPGRGDAPLLTTVGWSLSALALLAVIIHGLARVATRGRRK